MVVNDTPSFSSKPSSAAATPGRETRIYGKSYEEQVPGGQCRQLTSSTGTGSANAEGAKGEVEQIFAWPSLRNTTDLDASAAQAVPEARHLELLTKDLKGRTKLCAERSPEHQEFYQKVLAGEDLPDTHLAGSGNVKVTAATVMVESDQIQAFVEEPIEALGSGPTDTSAGVRRFAREQEGAQLVAPRAAVMMIASGPGTTSTHAMHAINRRVHRRLIERNVDRTVIEVVIGCEPTRHHTGPAGEERTVAHLVERWALNVGAARVPWIPSAPMVGPEYLLLWRDLLYELVTDGAGVTRPKERDDVTQGQFYKVLGADLAILHQVASDPKFRAALQNYFVQNPDSRGPTHCGTLAVGRVALHLGWVRSTAIAVAADAAIERLAASHQTSGADPTTDPRKVAEASKRARQYAADHYAWAPEELAKQVRRGGANAQPIEAVHYQIVESVEHGRGEEDAREDVRRAFDRRPQTRGELEVKAERNARARFAYYMHDLEQECRAVQGEGLPVLTFLTKIRTWFQGQQTVEAFEAAAKATRATAKRSRRKANDTRRRMDKGFLGLQFSSPSLPEAEQALNEDLATSLDEAVMTQTKAGLDDFLTWVDKLVRYGPEAAQRCRDLRPISQGRVQAVRPPEIDRYGNLPDIHDVAFVAKCFGNFVLDPAVVAETPVAELYDAIVRLVTPSVDALVAGFTSPIPWLVAQLQADHPERPVAELEETVRDYLDVDLVRKAENQTGNLAFPEDAPRFRFYLSNCDVSLARGNFTEIDWPNPGANPEVKMIAYVHLRLGASFTSLPYWKEALRRLLDQRPTRYPFSIPIDSAFLDRLAASIGGSGPGAASADARAPDIPPGGTGSPNGAADHPAVGAH